MPSGSRFALVALLVLLLVGPASAQPAADPTLGPAVDGSDDARAALDGEPTVVTRHRVSAPTVVAQTAVPADEVLHENTTMRVQLTSDGHARWQVIARYNLTTEAGIEGFRDTGEAFRAGEIQPPWLSAYRQARMQASEATGRTMRIHSVERSWNVDEHGNGTATGRVVLSFTWTNFARVTDDGQRLVVEDVFRTPTGNWISLNDGQTLIISPPEEYTPVTGGTLEDRSFYWEGPQSFDSNVPSAVFTGGPGPSTLLIASVVVGGLVVVLLIVYLVARRRGALSGSGGDDAADRPSEAAERAADGADTSPDASGDGTAASADADDAESTDDAIDEELLSDEERVERLLERNGGRMKQASIVKETGWSNAKVSQLLSAMEEADRIDKLRIGRENLISFPDEDVADVEE